MNDLFLRIILIAIVAITMGIVIYVLEKSTKEFEEEVDRYYEDIHNIFRSAYDD